MKNNFAILLIVSFTHPAFSQKDEKVIPCDSANFSISSTKAVEIALAREYAWYVRNKVESVLDSGQCVWKITLRQALGERHHGNYSSTWHVYYIDPQTGEIIRQTGWKQLDGPIPKGALD